MTCTLARVYFNRHAPLPWSVDSGPNTPEMETMHVVMQGAYLETVYDPDAGDNFNKPTAWIEVRGRVEIEQADEQIIIRAGEKQ